jgi:hypothetical protein
MTRRQQSVAVIETQSEQFSLLDATNSAPPSQNSIDHQRICSKAL